ncbi:hypothetical protein Bca4012_042534 [Brassica carinata]
MGEEPEREHKGDDRYVVHFEIREIPPDPIIRISKKGSAERRCRRRVMVYAMDGSYSRGPVGINVGGDESFKEKKLTEKFSSVWRLRDDRYDRYEDVSVMWLPCDVTAYVDDVKEEDDIDTIKEAENERNDVEANHEVGGSSFNDLSLTDFLDKFMEKKPKQNTWHSGSQIDPSKKDDYVNSVLAFTRTIGDCELKTADSFHCPPLHL